jgi:hypothetical protein
MISIHRARQPWVKPGHDDSSTGGTSCRRQFYVRKIAEKRTGGRAAIKIAAASLLHAAVKCNKS